MARTLTLPAIQIRAPGRRVALKNTLVHLVLLASVVVVLLPYYLMISTSLKPIQEIFTDPFSGSPRAWPGRTTWTPGTTRPSAATS